MGNLNFFEKSATKQPKMKFGNLPLSEAIFSMGKASLARAMWSFAPRVERILANSPDVESARKSLRSYLSRIEPRTEHAKGITRSRASIKRLRQIIEERSEQESGFSALEALRGIARGEQQQLDSVSEGFLHEFIYIMRGLSLASKGGRGSGAAQLETAQEMSGRLDGYSFAMQEYFDRYACGLHEELAAERAENARALMRHFGASESEWADFNWQLRHIILSGETLAALPIKFSSEEKDGLDAAARFNVPFQITPHYLSLFDFSGKSEKDRAIRSLVLPTRYYCELYSSHKDRKGMDFMGEGQTSPIAMVTRRYPQIVILKPFNACPQICQYCQRDWELESIIAAKAPPRKRLENALGWISSRPSICEVLITGGDPLTLKNSTLEWIFSQISQMPHIERIRIGTRTPVTMPMRFDDDFLQLLARHHEWGRREVCIVTHFEHPAEITPESLHAITRLKMLGINIYNQEVFTYFNSRRFETAYLRTRLKLSGVDPYYTFNTKGKEETNDFRVPIARILQERKEEARLLPGIVRTDEPVFNIPMMGKLHLRAGQDREIIMVMPDGARVYRFYPWDTRDPAARPYVYTDIPITSYLSRLRADGENVSDYASIWAY